MCREPPRVINHTLNPSLSHKLLSFHLLQRKASHIKRSMMGNTKKSGKQERGRSTKSEFWIPLEVTDTAPPQLPAGHPLYSCTSQGGTDPGFVFLPTTKSTALVINSKNCNIWCFHQHLWAWNLGQNRAGKPCLKNKRNNNRHCWTTFDVREVLKTWRLEG